MKESMERILKFADEDIEGEINDVKVKKDLKWNKKPPEPNWSTYPGKMDHEHVVCPMEVLSEDFNLLPFEVEENEVESLVFKEKEKTDEKKKNKIKIFQTSLNNLENFEEIPFEEDFILDNTNMKLKNKEINNFNDPKKLKNISKSHNVLITPKKETKTGNLRDVLMKSHSLSDELQFLKELLALEKATNDFDCTQFSPNIDKVFDEQKTSFSSSKESNEKIKHFNKEKEDKKFREWKIKNDQKLQEEFNKKQKDFSRQMEKDLWRVEKLNQDKQKEEEKFLFEEEVISKKNKRDFSNVPLPKHSISKFTMNALFRGKVSDDSSSDFSSVSRLSGSSRGSKQGSLVDLSTSSGMYDFFCKSLKKKSINDDKISTTEKDYLLDDNMEKEKNSDQKLVHEVPKQNSFIPETATVEFLENIEDDFGDEKEDENITMSKSINLIKNNDQKSKQRPKNLLLKTSYLKKETEPPNFSFSERSIESIFSTPSPTIHLTNQKNKIKRSISDNRSISKENNFYKSEKVLYQPNSPPDAFKSPVDFLFDYHEKVHKNREFWFMSPLVSKPVNVQHVPSLFLPQNSPQMSCKYCQFPISNDSCLHLYSLEAVFHEKCFRCYSCGKDFNNLFLPSQQNEDFFCKECLNLESLNQPPFLIK